MPIFQLDSHRPTVGRPEREAIAQLGAYHITHIFSPSHCRYPASERG